ncbi:MAG: DUF1540 domain-containing protein [Acutalibacteraceae bacterium]|jgi:hypothetical protein
MTNVKCDAIHCASNAAGRCCRPGIRVDGCDACRADETFCASYTAIPRGATNDTGYRHPNEEMSVRCDADECVYNDSGRCDADAITVSGRSAQDRRQTACATFESRR